MQVRIEDVSPVEKKLVVSVPWSTVSGKISEAYRDLAKNVNLKGFRKGKVPRTVLERMFGARVKAEVAGQLVRESFITAATEHKLDAVSEPRLDEMPDLEKGKDLSFEAIVEVKGDVVAKDYDGMQLSKRPLKVDETAVDEALEQVRREHTELMPIEERDTLSDKDVVSISCVGTVGEHEVNRPNLAVDLGDSKHQPLPGLVERLIGLKLDTADHKLEFEIPADHEEKEIAGAKVDLTISVLDAREKDVPDLDDEFAKDTGKGETLAELKSKLRAELEEAQRDQIAAELRSAALEELVKRNQIPVAKSLIDRVVHNKFHRLQHMLGIHDPHHEHAGFTDDLKEKLAEGADDEVRGQLLIEAVAEQEKIEVTDADLDDRIAKMAELRGGAVKPAKLRAEMDRSGQLDSLRFQVRNDKTLDLLVSKASVVEKEPEPESASDSE